MRRLWGIAVAAVLVACCAAPAAAAPVAGSYYVATAPGAERPTFVRVARDGRRLTIYDFAFKARCSDGVTRGFGLNEVREKRFGLTADGRFDFRSVPRRFSVGDRGQRITGQGSLQITGAFAGDTAALTLRQTFTGRTTCDQAVPLTLNRVGSPGLPSRDDVMITGRYRQNNPLGDPVQVAPFRTVGPARLVEGLTISWNEGDCSRGLLSYRDAYSFGPLLLNARGGLSLSIRDRYKLRGGYRAHLRARLSLRFNKGVPDYAAEGSWRATTRLYRRGKYVGTCVRPPTTFLSTAR